MSYFLSIKRFTVVLLSLFFISVSCSQPILTNTESILTSSDTTLSITIVNAPQNVLIQSTGTLNAILAPANDITVISWVSSDPTIVNIDLDTGEYEARSSGTATITVTAMLALPSATTFHTDTAIISVTDTFVNAESISIDDPPSSMIIRDSGTFTATVLPATHTAGAIQWSASTPEGSSYLIQDILQLDSITGLFRALDEGTVIITATVGDGAQSKTDSFTFDIESPTLLSIEIIALPTKTLTYNSVFSLSTILRTTVPTIEYRGPIQWIFPESELELLYQTSNSSATFRVLAKQGETISIMAAVDSISDTVLLETLGISSTLLIETNANSLATTVPLTVPDRGFFEIELATDDPNNNMGLENIRYVWSFSTSEYPTEDRANLELNPVTGEYHLIREGLFTLTVLKQGTVPGSGTVVDMGETSDRLVVFPDISVETIADDNSGGLRKWFSSEDTYSNIRGSGSVYYENGVYKQTLVVGLQTSNQASVDPVDRAKAVNSKIQVISTEIPARHVSRPESPSDSDLIGIASVDILGEAIEQNYTASKFSLNFTLDEDVARSVLPEITSEDDSFPFLAHPLYFITSEGTPWEVELKVYVEFEFLPTRRLICICICCFYI